MTREELLKIQEDFKNKLISEYEINVSKLYIDEFPIVGFQISLICDKSLKAYDEVFTYKDNLKCNNTKIDALLSIVSDRVKQSVENIYDQYNHLLEEKGENTDGKNDEKQESKGDSE